MASKLYEPSARSFQTSFSVEGRVYVWGGVCQDVVSGSENDITKLRSCIERFDPYLEVWTRINTAGTLHPGLIHAAVACTSRGEHVYMYGG